MDMKQKTVTVIGGRGRMGALMARLFSKVGHRVFVVDAKDGPIDWSAAAQSDVVLAAVPISSFESVIKELGPHTRPDGVVIDVASLKEQPVRLMLEHCRGEVIGTHPLFGPVNSTLEGLTFFVCPARSGMWLTWFRAFIKTLGAKYEEIDPGLHDRLMSRIQVLRHLFMFSFGRSLMRLEFDLEGAEQHSGRWFTELMNQLRNQLAQGPDLYADLTLFNPESPQVLEEFFKAADEVTASFSSGDRDRIINLINEVSAYVNRQDAQSAVC
jgi:prephenate dehydrogenase